jgi:hypothetical protein
MVMDQMQQPAFVRFRPQVMVKMIWVAPHMVVPVAAVLEGRQPHMILKPRRYSLVPEEILTADLPHMLWVAEEFK